MEIITFARYLQGAKVLLSSPNSKMKRLNALLVQWQGDPTTFEDFSGYLPLHRQLALSLRKVGNSMTTIRRRLDHIQNNVKLEPDVIRREVNTARAKVSDDSRGIEAGGHDVSNQLDNVRRLADRLMPYVNSFEYVRWFVGFGTTMCVLLIWIILLGALCCRCSSGEHRVKTSLLWQVI
ncbi:unnamed protein product [Trichogramma brassicae]|uniref:Uncharacterized protein n=1 Tax=Trichogramma brassicae TaxID=86971 RepID=A0A6H5I2S1_9HYME|nr:unnamed protein product [Trichogramma brassicae]